MDGCGSTPREIVQALPGVGLPVRNMGGVIVVRTARLLGILILALSLFPAVSASAATTDFCNDTFKAAYTLGESIAPSSRAPL